MLIVHPGRVLRREIEARGLSANALALALRTPSGRITDILNGKRGISPETAMRLGRYFGNSAQFWLNLQMAYELAVAERGLGARISAEAAPAAALKTDRRSKSSNRRAAWPCACASLDLRGEEFEEAMRRARAGGRDEGGGV